MRGCGDSEGDLITFQMKTFEYLKSGKNRVEVEKAQSKLQQLPSPSQFIADFHWPWHGMAVLHHNAPLD